MIKKLLLKKKEGNGDLIASLVVLVALVLFVLYFIHVIADVDTRIQLDQVARKYILRMESSGELGSDRANLTADLEKIPAVKKALSLGGDIKISTVEKNGYGSTITLTIECPVATTQYNPDSGMLGSIKRDNVKVFKITKQSTAKY